MEKGGKLFHPGLSLDCVIFGFHDNQLKVLLLKMEHTDHWALPGGFVYKDEALEAAATRVLQERTGINDIFLQQFHVFGDPARSDRKYHSNRLKKLGIQAEKDHWLLNRFITVGFYALVEFSHVTPMPDNTSVACEWQHLHDIGNLFMDHRQILDQALETLRQQLNYQRIGCMPDGLFGGIGNMRKQNLDGLRTFPAMNMQAHQLIREHYIFPGSPSVPEFFNFRVGINDHSVEIENDCFDNRGRHTLFLVRFTIHPAILPAGLVGIYAN